MWLCLTFVFHFIYSQVIAYTAHRASLSEYIRQRMMTVAPNLTVLVGEIIGARLMAHAGQSHNDYNVPYFLLSLFLSI